MTTTVESNPSPMLMMIKNKYPENEYPPNLGMPWYAGENIVLLRELSSNMSLEEIAKRHGRTIGGIRARINRISLEMYKSKKPISEIIEITKIRKSTMNNIIRKSENTENQKKTKKILLNEINELKEKVSLLERKIAEQNTDN